MKKIIIASSLLIIGLQAQPIKTQENSSIIKTLEIHEKILIKIINKQKKESSDLKNTITELKHRIENLEIKVFNKKPVKFNSKYKEKFDKFIKENSSKDK